MGVIKIEFHKYQKLRRFGTVDVDGINVGECFVFPKLDGTNASVWLGENGKVKAGSRNRELSLDSDNAGFYNQIINDKNILSYLQAHPTHRLYGEFLVPHTLRTYREDAWRKFYIFDVTIDTNDEAMVEYITYDEYKPLLDEHKLEYISPIAKIVNPSYERLVELLDENKFLIEDGKGVGEGIVIKNYSYRNKFGRVNWAKLVTSEFKEKHNRTMGYSEIKEKKMVEEDIVNQFCTEAFIEKEYAKIVNEKEGWRSQYIPMLLNKVYYELITEEVWNILKKFKNPKVDFGTLKHLVTDKIKRVKQDLFS